MHQATVLVVEDQAIACEGIVAILAASLGAAIHHQQLTLHYQPQFDLRSGRVCGVEALARWFTSEGKWVAPSVFIPIAEQTGLIAELGVWTLRAACRAAMEWPATEQEAPRLCVNVSTRQICPAFTEYIAAVLEDSALPAERLELEITESVLLGDVDRTLNCLAQWKRLGVSIAIDDFGSGYSNLGDLAQLPVDRLKIDNSMIRGMTHDSRDAAMVRSVISLSHELGFTALAEGVETLEQLAMLEDLGCPQAQGYLLGRPEPAPEALFAGKRRPRETEEEP
jgi:EAL domain-containing protein (putative c-di-GMP-specific phosphodiesterase class I)